MKTKKYLILKIVILVFITTFLCGNMVNANEKIDKEQVGTLNIIVKESEQKIYVENAIVKLYYIEEITDYDNVSYAFTNEFSDLANMQLNKEDEKEYAKGISKYIKQRKINGIQLNTNKQGEAKFTNLKLGKYLIEVDTFSINDTKYTALPFIISIPMNEQNVGWNYVISANPKIAKVEVKVEENTPEKEEIKGDLPNTGMLMWPIPVLLLLGLAFIITGCYIYKKKEK